MNSVNALKVSRLHMLLLDGRASDQASMQKGSIERGTWKSRVMCDCEAIYSTRKEGVKAENTGNLTKYDASG